MRGLKHFARHYRITDSSSHAVCVRGLKQHQLRIQVFATYVARRVRAWIETNMNIESLLLIQVARRVRAWIETLLKNPLN